MNKIQSFSNIITNSSSEVFIIETNKPDEIIQFVSDVCDVLGYDMNDIMETTVASADGSVYGWGSISCKKGNVILQSTSDNSIPWTLMDLIADLAYIPKTENICQSVDRRHLG